MKRSSEKMLSFSAHARNLHFAHKSAQQFVEEWETRYPKVKVVACLRGDLPDVLRFPTSNAASPHGPAVPPLQSNGDSKKSEEGPPMGTFS